MVHLCPTWEGTDKLRACNAVILLHHTISLWLLQSKPVLGDMRGEWWVGPQATIGSLGRGLSKSLSMETVGVGVCICSAEVQAQWRYMEGVAASEQICICVRGSATVARQCGVCVGSLMCMVHGAARHVVGLPG